MKREAKLTELNVFECGGTGWFLNPFLKELEYEITGPRNSILNKSNEINLIPYLRIAN